MAMAMAMAMRKQQRSKSNWEGMLRWCWRSAHSDSVGTHRPPPQWEEGVLKRWCLEQGTQRPAPSGGIQDDHRPAPSGGIQDDHRPPLAHSYGTHYRPPPPLPPQRSEEDVYVCLSEEDVVACHVYEIAQYFKVPEDKNDLGIKSVDPAQFENGLITLQGYAVSMELAHELHSIDCLVPLLNHVLYNQHAGIRAKTAELITAMVHNNPRSQDLVWIKNGLQPLLYNFTSDPDANSRTKALGAISALMCHHKPSIFEFQCSNGYAKLRDALSLENDVRLQRDTLNLILYLLHESSSDCGTVTELGLPRIMMHLASSDDAMVREAALRVLLVLARNEKGGNSGQLVKNDDKLKQVLQERIEVISAVAPKDLGAARKEIQLVDSLWNACYNEPSSLGEKGLLVLPGKDGNIVAVLGLPRIMIHLASSDDAEVREAALRGLLVLARDEEGGNSGQLVKNDNKLKQILEERIEGISEMAPEDLGAATEEKHLVGSLWNVCYNKPSH